MGARCVARQEQTKNEMDISPLAAVFAFNHQCILYTRWKNKCITLEPFVPIRPYSAISANHNLVTQTSFPINKCLDVKALINPYCVRHD